MIRPRGKELVVVIGSTGTGKSKLAIELLTSRFSSESRTPPSSSSDQKLSDCGHKGFPLGGEIINGDSMQVYKGLDVMTNKVRDIETRGIRHHLMSFLDIDQDYTVERFRTDATEKIREIHDKNLLPIIVGGTGYYIQNLVFPGRLVRDSILAKSITGLTRAIDPSNGMPSNTIDQKNKQLLSDSSSSTAIIEKFIRDGFESSLVESFRSLPNELLQLCFILPSLPPISTPDSLPRDFPIELLPIEFRPPESTTEDLCLGLYEALKVVDPIMAQRWHWRNLRKVRRSLEVIVCSGKRMSSLIDEQDRRDESVDSGNEQIIPYRTLIFWLYSEPNQLNQRLDSRVEKMLKEGLIEEVRDLKRRRFQLVKNMDVDYSRGPYQAIGYREFERIVSLETDNIQESEISTASDLTKLSTRQYAKAQVKWMKSKFLPELNRSMRSKELEGFKTAKDGDEVLIYLLDSSDLERWKSDVFEPAQKVLNNFLRHYELPSPSSLSPTAQKIFSESMKKKPLSLDQLRLRVCSVCTADSDRPVMIEEKGWMDHLNSKRHRRAGRPARNTHHRTTAS